VRFIPACAGNTFQSQLFHLCQAVHPRLRGEHVPISHSTTADDGSSPPARGTLCCARRQSGCLRFIPACAGNTSAIPWRLMLESVHPRLRGEHLGSGSAKGCLGGSSPPARGTRSIALCNRKNGRFIPACAGNTRHLAALLAHQTRFIPACAGNTSVPSTRRCSLAVHPRLRGEHPSMASPMANLVRFIPACAGNTG